jgi:hypothetical protein
VSPTHLQVVITEFYGKGRARQIYCNLEELPAGATVKKGARAMLAKAAERFQEPAPAQRRD